MSARDRGHPIPPHRSGGGYRAPQRPGPSGDGACYVQRMGHTQDCVVRRSPDAVLAPTVKRLTPVCDCGHDVALAELVEVRQLRKKADELTAEIERLRRLNAEMAKDIRHAAREAEERNLFGRDPFA